MNRSDAPNKQAVPFAINGQRENLLPTTPAGDNTASYDSGFPPVTMILKAAGGLPPKGQDMNQILYELSSLGRWMSAGALNAFDPAFSTSIGGYPKAAVLIGDDGVTPYISTIDANNNNPNSSVTGWLSLAKIISIAGLAGGANKLPYFTGVNAVAQTDLTQVGRDVIGKSDVASILTYLGLGSAAQRDVGTGTNQIPDINSFTNSRSASGWLKLPGTTGGLIIQWANGRATNREEQYNVNFPIPFPGALLQGFVSTTGQEGILSDIMFQGVSGTLTYLTIQSQIFTGASSAGSVAPTILAIGY